VFRTVGDQPSLWESILPEEVRRLPDELTRVDRLLDDPVFFAPFVPHFDPRIGRPSTPMEVYLRLMFLKYRYRMGYETLCREVSDSISWRRFCRIPLDGSVPHPTTLMKLTTRCGESAVAGLNEALWAKAAEAKLLRTTRVRADTTVIPANVAYPTDSGLLAKAVGKLARTVGRVKAAGAAPRTKSRDRRRAASRRVRQIAGKLRTRGKLAREESTAAIRRVTGELAGLAEKAAADAAAVLRNGRRALRRIADGRVRGQLRRALDELADTIERTGRVVKQTRTRLSGRTPDGATRLVSLHDPDARPIRKGRIDRPVEFGYKAQVVDNDDGVVLDHTVEAGAATDAPQLAPAVKRIRRRTGRPPRTVTADRGYGEASVERDLQNLGVRTVAIPRKAKTSRARREIEHSRGFRRLVKWRTGSEGRISYLKRVYGWDRSRLDGQQGAAIWCGYGVFAHNLTKIGGLTT
jgi:transposase, IS5 family